MNKKHFMRSLFLSLSLGMALLGGTFGSATAHPLAPCIPTNYPTFGYDMGRTSWNTAECILSPTSSPTLTWINSYAAPLGTREGISTFRNHAYFGVGMTLNAIDNTTGALVWSFPTGGSIKGSATICLNHLLFGSDDTNLYALDPATGIPLWTNSLKTPIISTPVCWNGLAIVTFVNGLVAAFDIMTGKLVWLNTSLGLQVSTPSVFNDQVYISAQVSTAPKSVVYDLSASSGIIQWLSPAFPAILTVPVLGSNFLYVGTSDPAQSIVALKATIGAIAWTSSIKEPVLGKPAFDGKRVYMIGGTSGLLFALNASSGTVDWVNSAPFGPLYLSGSPTVANGVVYVGSTDVSGTGWLYAFSITGPLLWNQQVPGYVNSPATVVNGWIYISTISSPPTQFVIAFK